MRDAGPQGPRGLTSLVSVTAEPPGSNCAPGGTRLDCGVDANANGVLDPGEIQATTYVCGGCSRGTTACGATCASLPGDPSNCATCGHACAPGSACAGDRASDS